uniref:Uncharacterized protein n=1 Tax=Mycena chlorophos TaxID=658473 RepID=A0ABQ0MCV9_MYCCL|nr:predicted protein [Mycena chlorophos]
MSRTRARHLEDTGKQICFPPATLPSLREIVCPDPCRLRHILDSIRFDPEGMADCPIRMSFGMSLAPSLGTTQDKTALLSGLRTISRSVSEHSASSFRFKIAIDVYITEAASARIKPPSASTVGDLSALEDAMEKIRLIGGPHWWPREEEVRAFRPWVQASIPRAADLISAWVARGDLWGDDVVQTLDHVFTTQS